MARLLNDVQAGQSTMAAVLHQLAPGQDSFDRTGLNLSVYMVEAHRGRIMEKLNLHSTGELVRFAFRNGIID